MSSGIPFDHFLAARLDEDEERADRVEFRPYAGEGVPQSLRARVLSEVAANRAAIEAAWADHVRIEGEWGLGRSRAELEAMGDLPDAVLHLASIYADHPDYRQEWSPASTLRT